MKFEEAIEKLEEIVKKMESDQISIDDSLKYFSEGIKLCKECQETLKEAKGKIALLQKEADEIIENSFEVDGE